MYFPQVHRGIHRILSEYKDSRKGPTVIFLQSPSNTNSLSQAIPALDDFPRVSIQALDRLGSYDKNVYYNYIFYLFFIYSIYSMVSIWEQC